MGKKLIIKGADFSAVAIDTPIPPTPPEPPIEDIIIKDKLFSDGVTAYIDTNIVLTANDVLDIVLEFGGTFDKTRFAFGWRNVGSSANADGNTMVALNLGYNQARFVSGGYGDANTSILLDKDTEYHIRIDYVHMKTYLNDIEQTSTPAINMQTSLGTIPLALFTANLAGSINQNFLLNAESSIKYCGITRNGARILDLKPCHKVSINLDGMYDSVSDTFIGPTNGGAFTAQDDE